MLHMMPVIVDYHVHFTVSCPGLAAKVSGPPKKPTKYLKLSRKEQIQFVLIMIKTQLTPKVTKMKVQSYGQGCSCVSFCERNCAVCFYIRSNFSVGETRKVNNEEEIDARTTCSELPKYQT